MADTDESNSRLPKAHAAGLEGQVSTAPESGASSETPSLSGLPASLELEETPVPAAIAAAPAASTSARPTTPEALLASTAAPAAITAPLAEAGAKPRKFVAAPRKAAASNVAAAKPATAMPEQTQASPAPVQAPEAEQPAPPQAQADATVSPDPTNRSQNFTFKDKTMDMTANFSGFQDAVSEAQAKAQAAFEKSTSVLGEVSEFAKGNLEALVESGKILAGGVQDLGSTLVSESRTAFESATSDIKELAAAKSPTDFLKLQSDMMRKSFDTAVAYGSKNSEAMLKLMSEAMAPLSGRVSLAVEKARQTATL